MSTTNIQILQEIDKLIATKHVTVTDGDYQAWKQSLEQATPALAQATPDEFLLGVNKLLAGLRTSHTAFLKPDGETMPLRHALCATVRSVHSGGKQAWMFREFSAGLRDWGCGMLLTSFNRRGAKEDEPKGRRTDSRSNRTTATPVGSISQHAIAADQTAGLVLAGGG
jgi:hypothetical protein